MTRTQKINNDEMRISDNIIRIGNTAMFVIGDVTVIASTHFVAVIGSQNVFDRVHKNIEENTIKTVEGTRYGVPCTIIYLDENTDLFIRKEGSEFGDPSTVTLVYNEL